MNIERFRKSIVKYYEKFGRTFPWRDTDNDFHALVAEIMLQQTSYYQVEPSYNRFTELYESPEDVLNEKYERLEGFFDNLGLSRRAEYVLEAARFLNSEKEITQDNLMDIKGVGRYTANAFLSIHKGLRYPIVDGNVIRVFERYFPTKMEDRKRKEVWRLAGQLLPEDDVREYNLGLIDYGSYLYEKRKEGGEDLEELVGTQSS